MVRFGRRAHCKSFTAHCSIHPQPPTLAGERDRLLRSTGARCGPMVPSPASCTRAQASRPSHSWSSLLLRPSHTHHQHAASRNKIQEVAATAHLTSTRSTPDFCASCRGLALSCRCTRSGPLQHAMEPGEIARTRSWCDKVHCPRARPHACPESNFARLRRLDSQHIHRGGGLDFKHSGGGHPGAAAAAKAAGGALVVGIWRMERPDPLRPWL